MNKKYKITLIAIILLIASIVIYYYYKDEKVKILKEYSPTGNLIGTNEYVVRDGNIIMHGKFINYNEKGIKISEGQFIDNEPKGLCYYYDDNGKIESVYFRKNSNINLECKYYNQEGLLTKNIMCDDFGNTAFLIFFDEKGVIKYEGYFQIETYQYKYANKTKSNITEVQNLKVGDTLKYSYLVANIPNAKRSFKIENVGSNNEKIKRIIKKVEPCQIDVKEVLTKKGKNTIRSVVKYEFNDKVTPVFTDTHYFEVNVY